MPDASHASALLIQSDLNITSSFRLQLFIAGLPVRVCSIQ